MAFSRSFLVQFRSLESSSTVFLRHRRPNSTYGYAQAKALVYPRHGSVPDVLEYLYPSSRLSSY